MRTIFKCDTNNNYAIPIFSFKDEEVANDSVMEARILKVRPNDVLLINSKIAMIQNSTNIGPIEEIT